jgi:type II secretory pathway component PulK
VALVTILVLEYHFDATVEMELADNYAREVQAQSLALTGLNFAQIVLQRDNPEYDAPDEPWSLLSIFANTACVAPQQLLEWAKSLAETQARDASGSGRGSEQETSSFGSPFSLGSSFGSSFSSSLSNSSGSPTTTDAGSPETVSNGPECIRFSIVDESRKLPINALLGADTNQDDINPVWRQIFESFFISFEIAPEAVSALIDWIDVSPGYLDGGAEDEYYEGLEHPYKTPNRPMQVPGELRLVRHFDCETLAKLFPGKACKDMADIDLGSNEYLTPYGGSGTRVNLNTASEAVLNAITEGNTACVSSILDKRIQIAGQLVSEPIRTATDIPECSNPPNPNFAQVAGVQSTYFRVESQGEVGGRIKKKVVAVLQRNGQQTLPSVVYFKVE